VVIFTTMRLFLQFHNKERVFPVHLKGGSPSHGYITEEDGAIQIQLYYPCNPAIGVFGRCSPKSKCLGFHDDDVEAITIYADGRVHLSCHGSREGNWTHLDDLEKLNGIPVIFVALHSHAMYPRRGRHWRIFGFGNDLCSIHGELIFLNTDLMVPAFDYTFPTGYFLRRGLRPPPPEKTLSKFWRFFLPCGP
jgi:hypothetical protein